MDPRRYIRRSRDRPLTELELYVLARVAAGHSYDGIAADLGSTRQAVTAHLYRIRPALGARTTAHAVAIAMHRRLFPAAVAAAITAVDPHV